MKMNCWEFKKCGREPGGIKESELGICPASTEMKLDGVHGGTNSGRTCWAVAGTFCAGEIQGTFAEKFNNCKECDFYKEVYDEEMHNFVLIKELMEQLKEGREQISA